MAARHVIVLGWLTWLASAALAQDSVVNSPHDLSAFGPGPIRALDESRVCIFCHVPHNADAAAPLWNRYNPRTHYRIYRSPSVDARIDQPGPASKQCLSCHDGSVALGLTLHRDPTDPIPLNQPYLPTGPSNLTNDLSDDHPIGFRYDRALTNRDPQLRAPELVDSRLPLGDWGEVECTACHDPHNNEFGNFLRIPERRGALCVTCHDLHGWDLSVHANTPLPVPPAATSGEILPFRSMADNACRACHVSHGAPERERLLYDRASRQCLHCHDGSVGKTILPALDYRSAHRVNRVFARRGSPENRRVPSRFVECSDCHNPHAVQRQMLSGPAAARIVPPNMLPPGMQGVPGVSRSGAPVDPARFYYEVCFRCHSERPVSVNDRIVRQQDARGNVRRQFLPSSASAHPLLTPASGNPLDSPSLTASARQRRQVGCEDCHGNGDAAGGGGGVRGPHGSPFEYLLTRRYETADFTTESSQAYALCYSCHDRNSILNNESFPLHRRHIVRGRSPCSACHTAHGVAGSSARHSHLINFDLAIVRGQRLFVDQGTRRGSCTLSCHGIEHVNFGYGN